MALAIGVDVGGTKVLAAVVDEHGTVLQRARAETPSDDPVATEDTIARVVDELRADHAPVAVGIGAAGFIDAAAGIVRHAPNLAWRDEPLAERVAERIGMPCRVENDASAAAWAEYRFGAAVGARVLLMVTVGTGIGGGLVFDGRLFRGAFGAAGEPGHMNVVPDGLPCGCGRNGCFEQYCSGTALVRLDGGGRSGPQVTDAAAAGEPSAVAAFAEIGRWLGVGLADLAAVLDPDVVVVGGGVSEAGGLLMTPAQASFGEQRRAGGMRELTLRSALLGNDAGMVGAADLARAAQ